MKRPLYISGPVSRVLSYPAHSLIQNEFKKMRDEMAIYLALPLLAGSSDLTRPDTDVIYSRSEQLLNQDLFGLAPRRDCLVSPYSANQPAKFGYGFVGAGPYIGTLVLRSPTSYDWLKGEADSSLWLCILVFRRTAVSRYAALKSSDFPPNLRSKFDPEPAKDGLGTFHSIKFGGHPAR